MNQYTVPMLMTTPIVALIVFQAPAQAMEILIKELTADQPYTLTVELSDTIEEVKSKIYEIRNQPPDQQRLIFNGQEMKDGKTLSDYGVGEGATVHQVLRLRGG